MRRTLVILALLSAVAGGLAISSRLFAPRISSAPRQGTGPEQVVYVWQRNWTEPVSAGIRRASAKVSRYLVLTCEIETSRGDWRAFAPEVDWSALAETGRPIWPVIRARSLPGLADPRKRSHWARILAQEALRCRKAASRAHTRMAGLQLDFDCPSEDLARYSLLLSELKSAVPDTPLSITVLPDWLGRPGFAAVIRGLDHFVLQVHSLGDPSEGDASSSLFEPSQLEPWLQQASSTRCPFFVAFPTYGYLLLYDSSGRFLGLGAESWPGSPYGAAGREIASDPATIAAAVRLLSSAPPEGWLGNAWFRLPVETDRRNWPWPLLEQVMEGQAPEPNFLAEVRCPQEGLFEVWLKNQGLYRPAQQVQLTVEWKQGSLESWDALSGYRGTPGNETTSMQLDGLPPRPYEDTLIAWFRFISGPDGFTVRLSTTEATP